MGWASATVANMEYLQHIEEIEDREIKVWKFQPRQVNVKAEQ
jgi:hypothetical protein